MQQKQVVFEKYARHIEAYCGWSKVDGKNPDEEFMREIESTIGISDLAKKAFREEVLIRISAYKRKGRVFDCTSHERLSAAIDKYIEPNESA